jgi:hypothetical protein
MEPLGHRVTVLDRVECGFSDLVMSLEPEGSAGSFALAAAPARVGQGQTPSIASHTAKLACPGIMPSYKAKFDLRRYPITPERLQNRSRLHLSRVHLGWARPRENFSTFQGRAERAARLVARDRAPGQRQGSGRNSRKRMRRARGNLPHHGGRSP